MFEQSIPVEIVPEQDTTTDTAELENHEEEVEQEATEVESQHEEQADEQEETDSEQEHSDELLAGKFKSQEDLVNAYKGLERKLHDRSAPQQQQASIQPQFQNEYQEDPNDVVMRMLNEDPIGTINYFVQQAVNPLQEERTTEKLAQNISSMAKEYGELRTETGMEAYFNKISEIAQDLGNPNLARNPSPRVLKLAAEELWPKSMAQVYKQAEQAGRQAAEQSRKAKQGLNAPSNSKPKEMPKSPEEQIADSIVGAGKRGGLFG